MNALCEPIGCRPRRRRRWAEIHARKGWAAIQGPAKTIVRTISKLPQDARDALVAMPPTHLDLLEHTGRWHEIDALYRAAVLVVRRVERQARAPGVNAGPKSDTSAG